MKKTQTYTAADRAAYDAAANAALVAAALAAADAANVALATADAANVAVTRHREGCSCGDWACDFFAASQRATDQ